MPKWMFPRKMGFRVVVLASVVMMVVLAADGVNGNSDCSAASVTAGGSKESR